ncbi:MAG: class I SAM-dependent methyltransferase [Acidobacteriia bacterium]|nr:class I SAM-dependent methyltransferase [Terriglobia bacterium]
MSLLDTKRRVGIESPRGEYEIEGSDRAAEEYRSRLRNACIDHALRLGMQEGVVLNLGTRTGELAIRLAQCAPEVTVLGIDSSADRIGAATEAAESAGLLGRIHFQTADYRSTRFKSEYFDAVLCDGLMHQTEDPSTLIDEIARLVKSDGAILIRDWRRPSMASAWWHWRWFGRKYSTPGRQQFKIQVESSLSYSEWRALLKHSQLQGSARLFVEGLQYIGIERPAAASLFAGLAAQRERKEYLAETEGWRKNIRG